MTGNDGVFRYTRRPHSTPICHPGESRDLLRHDGVWNKMPASEAVSQFQSNILQVYVIPGLTRNPAVFLSFTPLDAGSGSGMTGNRGLF
ncbi:MAG: hypothetical protein V2I56_12490 [Desulfobacteraceae bacterium]|nr:hypothetical protein [Desulfobacteraceae bacterium]